MQNSNILAKCLVKNLTFRLLKGKSSSNKYVKGKKKIEKFNFLEEMDPPHPHFDFPWLKQKIINK